MEIIRLVDMPNDEQHRVRVAISRGKLKKYIDKSNTVCVDKQEYENYKANKSKGGRPPRGGIYV